MAEEKNNDATKITQTKKSAKSKNALIGAQTQPVTLDKQTKLDIDTDKKFVDNIIVAGKTSQLDMTSLENFTSISNSRDQIYQLIDTMMKDSTVSSIVRTYSEDVCEVADNGHIVWCESNNPNISKFVNYLLNVINVDKNIFKWVYSLIEYGDVYLKLYRESDYKDPIFKTDNMDKAYSAKTKLHESKEQDLDEAVYLKTHAANDPYSYYVEMVPDPGTMFELTKYGKTFGFIETPNQHTNQDYLSNYLGMNTTSGAYNYKMKTNDINVYQADNFVHACLDDNYTRYPETVNLFLTDEEYKTGTNSQAYTVKRGKSLLYDSYKIWREKSLLENSALLNRITRSSLVRKVQVEVGDMPKHKVQATLSYVKDLMEQKTAIDTGVSMSEYTNPGPIANNIYLATHEGKGGVTIEETGGDTDVKALADLDYWTNKFYASYGIPKQFFGWTEDGAGFNGGASLAITSSIYGKGVRRVQNCILQALTDLINLILVNKGCVAYLNNFVLKMKTPLSQEEKDYREDLTARVSAISNMQALFADIEDKPRRLEILQELVKTLNYGDTLSNIIAAEIDSAKAAELEEAKAAEEEAAATNEETEMPNEETEADNLELGSSAEAPIESLSAEETGDQLLEKIDFLENTDETLPTPESLNKNIDFTQNT